MEEYNHKNIESKWQQIWEEQKPYKAEYPSDKQKFYPLIEFPYTSGDGLHIGHSRAHCALDIVARKKRMEGFNVLYPIGWDAFGLPTENYAIKAGRPPQEITKENIDTFRRQIKSIGIGFDWDREVDTTDPQYYRWTQWIFLQLFKHGLAYKDNIAINWCPSCKIGLANEEVVQGMCERCKGPTEKRQKEQWMLEITKYADRLLFDLDEVNYLEKIKIQQQNWIGRKEWIDIQYPIKDSDQFIKVSTTRPDTNFGATFIVVAPEHKICRSELIPNDIKNQVNEYIEKSLKKSEEERISEGRKKMGVFTGIYAINRLNNKELPIWIADFVLSTVGTGAVVGVPGHDKRDFEFAKQFDLPIIRVVAGSDRDESEITDINQVQEEEGKMINSEILDGLDIHEATKKIMDYLEGKRWGKRTIRFHLRDWVFSRQHYWGEPIPVVYCKSCYQERNQKIENRNQLKLGRDYIEIKDEKYAVVPVPEDQLPIELPVVEKYQPTDTGESPLSSISDWVNTKCPVCGSDATRETDTMPNWAGSSWYFLRYIDPHNDKALADLEKLKYWLPVDLYNGGMEHTTLHLLYSRFWHKFLFDINMVPTKEPYQKRVSHGMILAPDGQKMSKSRGNVVNPDEMVEKFGADAFRLYEMFLGPFDQVVKWQTDGIRGTYRFLDKVWRMSSKVGANGRSPVQQDQQESEINRLIQKISSDIENMQFNTAVSSMMEFVNFIEKQKNISQSVFERFLIILSPFAPHIAEELWSEMGHQDLISLTIWPRVDESKIINDKIIYAISINGKLRDNLEVNSGMSEQEITSMAQGLLNIEKYLKDQNIKKTVFVKDKIINFVI